MGAAAAGGGSIEIMRYLKQWAVPFNTATFAAAAQAGRMHMLEFLLQEQCPFDDYATDCAAKAGHCDVLLWLRQHGCEWDTTDIHCTAVESGSTDMMQLVIDQGAVTTAAQLTEMLCTAADSGLLKAAKWLRKHHNVQWPAVLQDEYGYPWRRKFVRWARKKGCTSPIE
jgi:NAD(P)-dependent dehydrogenase (short-subunit alcohol dehydrogenase family)